MSNPSLSSLLRRPGEPQVPPPAPQRAVGHRPFGNKIRSAGLMPSFGCVGDGLDNAMMESSWSSMQIELLNRKRWKTRTELATQRSGIAPRSNGN